MSEISQLLDKPSLLLRPSSRAPHCFQPLKDVLQVVEFPAADGEEEEVDVDKLLRQLNSLEFRMQMHA